MTRRCGTAFFIISIFALSLSAQTVPAGGSISPEEKTAANEAYQKQDWKMAAAAYEKIAKAEQKNAGAHYRLGMSQLGLNQNSQAVASFESAISISPNSVFALAAARAYARAGDKAKMYDILEKSLTMGGIQPDSLTGEADFSAVKTEAKFIDLVKRSDLAVNPCKGRAESRQFDFWIGEWLPRNAAGLTVGTSSIQLILGSCVIFENWNTPVSSGKSFSNYSTADGKWHQTWVDDKGTLAYYTGEMVDGKMVLDAPREVNGKRTIARMTFSKLPSGDVRQHGESSADDGKSWTTTFDFTYVRKK
jgi:tetratricopeptide (TPR) repeat protein